MAVDILIDGRFSLQKVLGKGSFGATYSAVNTKNSGDMVAVKIEALNTQFPYLEFESILCKNLQSGVGFPQLYWHGIQDEYYCLVISLLGPNLMQLFEFCDHKFSEETVIMIALQCIDRIQFMHDKGYLH